MGFALQNFCFKALDFIQNLYNAVLYLYQVQVKHNSPLFFIHRRDFSIKYHSHAEQIIALNQWTIFDNKIYIETETYWHKNKIQCGIKVKNRSRMTTLLGLSYSRIGIQLGLNCIDLRLPVKGLDTQRSSMFLIPVLCLFKGLVMKKRYQMFKAMHISLYLFCRTQKDELFES